MKRIVVDPITRIEGHLRLELVLDDNGKVQDALSSGTAWRGIEVVLKDRDPRDAWAFAGRICGVCTSEHSNVSLRAVEDALDIEIPKNANYIRNIMAGAIMTHDHLVHFYHLHALDWVSPVAALKADPVAAANLQQTILANYQIKLDTPAHEFDAYSKETPAASPAYFQEIQAKVKEIVDSGRLGIFAAHWWDHPDYELLPPEVHLIGIAHYLATLDAQRDIMVPHIVFGGKNPHPHYAVGGMPCAISMNDMNAPVNSNRLAMVDNAISMTRSLVDQYYVADVLAIAQIHLAKGQLGGGGLAKERVLGYGDYPDNTFKGIGEFYERILMRSNGIVENFAAGVQKAKFHAFGAQDLTDLSVITEAIDHSWYKYPDGSKTLHPWQGVTEPNYQFSGKMSGKQWQELDENGKYSWLKTPTWRGKTAEVGPLARYIIVYTKVKQNIIQPNWVETMIVQQIEAASKLFALPPEVWLLTTVGRTVARALESQVCVALERYFFDKLIENIKNGDTTVMNNEKWEPSTWPKKAQGVGAHEVPRGSLGHWVVIENGRIKNYQAVVPTTWNACPRDADGQHGAFEQSMIDTPVKVADKPLEILRSIHSFDPCLACAAHLFDASGKEVSMVFTDPYL
ncbi:nickel-dependent hydrogenase large subunit [Sporomusa aerivorans]|uniref:nickel-dependent hydrogenase large subunit n=1 Tax=Sporomusa aerivorans TaxID=204936 RepID=UPI00352BA70A